MASMDLGGSAELFAGSAEMFAPLEELFRLITGSLEVEPEVKPT